MTLRARMTFLILAVLVSFTAAAQVAGPSAAARRAQVVPDASKGPTFATGSRQRYQVVVGLRAVVQGDSSPEARLEALGLPASDLLEVKGPFVIFQQAAPGATAKARVTAASAVTATDRTPAFPVVLNTQTGGLAVLPGIVIAKLRKPADAAALAAANGLEVDYIAESIRYGFFRVPDGQDVVVAAATLAQDPRVETAYPEVREHFLVSK